MQILRQVSILAENRPGALAKLTRVLASAKVNLLAISVPDSTDEGILRIVPDDAARLKSLLLQKGLGFVEHKVLAVSVGNRPGSLYKVARTLKAAKVDIRYAYGSACAEGERATLIFHVSDLLKARNALEGRGL